MTRPGAWRDGKKGKKRSCVAERFQREIASNAGKGFREFLDQIPELRNGPGFDSEPYDGPAAMISGK